MHHKRTMMLGRFGKGFFHSTGLAAWFCATAIGFVLCLPCRAAVTTTGSIYDDGYFMRVGDTGYGNLLVSAGSQLSREMAYMGYSFGSTGTAVVSGTGSTWTNRLGFYVGLYGAGSLTIQDGGQVSNPDCILGRYTGSSGTAAVSGTGSAWSTGQLHVGLDGMGWLTIQDGAQVSSLSHEYSYIGRGVTSSGTVVVSGPGSTWVCTQFYVGSSGSGSLTVKDAGQVNSYYSYIGYDSGSIGTIVVSGMGSTWATTSSLHVGDYGTASLTVQDSGLVSAGELWASLSDLHGDGTINANGGVLDADIVFDAANGLTQTFVFGSGGSLNLSVVSARVLGAGYKGAGSLRIADGCRVGSTLGYIGYHAGSSGAAVVSGTGSRWSTVGNLYVGNDGTGSLTVQDGGEVTSYYTYLAYNPGSSGVAVVSGTGATWTSAYLFVVGNYGAGSLTIQDGAQVSNSDSYLGRRAGSSGTAVVSGLGSRWATDSTGGLLVGEYGMGSLTIQNGGQVSSYSSYLGRYSGSSGTVVVSGTGATLITNGSLYVGDDGAGSLTVQDGGEVSAEDLYASLEDLHGNGIISTGGGVLDADMVFAAADGLSTVTFGSGGTLNLSVSSARILGAGYKGAGSLWITSGCNVTSKHGYLGYRSGSSGTAMVSGAGSAWTITGSLHIGENGTGSLFVEAGARVSSSSCLLAGISGSPGGTAMVSGTGSAFTCTNSLIVGGHGPGSLTVQDGGQVSNSFSYVGQYSGSSGTVIVSGTGARWTCTGALCVGGSGTGSLTVLGGGHVSSLDGQVAYRSGSSGTAVVSGAGSAWTTSSTLAVGASGVGRLTVADGGKATAKSVSINSQSTTNLRVSGDGMLVLGNAATAGSITNNGKVSFYADAFLAAGTYRPITEYAGRAINWSGSGSYNATGGAWDTAAKTFIVQPAVEVAGGVVAAVAEGQRLLVTDASSGKRVGASFPAVPAGTTFSADAMGSAELSGLALGSGEYVLAAWDFDTNFTGGSALLAFDVGIVPRPIAPAGDASAGVGASAATDGLTGGLKTYRLDGSSWELLPAGDFIYAQTGIASFTTSVFGGFAITAVSATGDADRDGQIDDDDLSLLLSNWNQPAGWTAGNFSGDGTVDDDDLSLLLSNWTGGPAPAVPGPATLALLALGVVGMLRRRRSAR